MERLTTKQRIIRRLQGHEKRFFDGRTMIKWGRLTEVELARISAIMVRYRDHIPFLGGTQ